MAHVVRRLLACVVVSLALIGCANAKFVPYEGAQNWPTAPGAFVDKEHAVPIYYGSPPRPYKVLGSLDATTAPIRRHDVVPYAASRAKQLGGDAVIVLSERTEYAGTYSSGTAQTTGTLTPIAHYAGGTQYNYNASTTYGGNSFAMFKGRATVLVIKFNE